MLVREGEDRTPAIDIRLAALLAAVAGAVNTAGFQAVGYFSANMTGNVSALSDHLGFGRYGLAALFASIVAAYVFGAFFSGLLIEEGKKRGARAIYAYSIAFEAGLLAGLGLADIHLAAVQSSPLLILGLSFVMGLQNAATTRISKARVRTTHVSGMATDIGLGLASLCHRPADREEVIGRLRLHGGTVLAFFLGGIAGLALYRFAGGYLFVAAAALLFAIALPEVRKARSGPPAGRDR